MSRSSSSVQADGRIVAGAVSPAPACDSSRAPYCWGITEGAAGMVSQVRGLAQALGGNYELKDITLRMPWRKCWPGIVPVQQSIFQTPERLQTEPLPRVVISCGRQAVPASLFLKKQLGERVFTVHIQDPRIRTASFDLIVTPEHDGLRGENVYATRGAVHHVNPRLLAAAAQSPAAESLKGLGDSFVTVLLGGPNNCYHFSVEELAPLVAHLRMLVRQQGIRLAVLPSRRTPQDVVALFQKWFSTEHFVWDRQSENPYLAALALGSHVIVTGDSVSMISEATATERPVYVYPLAERRRSRRFQKFHETFQAAGLTRQFTGQLDTWTYSSPNDTDRIAELIRARLGESHDIPERAAA